MKPMVLLTGPDGILGNNLIPLLVKNGYQVRAFMEPGRDKNPVWERGAEVVTGNLLYKEEIGAAIAGCEYVIHAAANTNVWPPRDKKIREVNITGTQNVIESVLQSDVKKLIHVGTANSFGPGTFTEPGDETRPYGCDKYGLDYMDSKYQAHLLVLQAIKEKRLPAVIVNPTFMIGPYDTKPSSGQLIISVCKGKIPGYTNGGRNYVDVRDVAQGIVNALEKGEVGQSYILGGQNLTYKEFFTMVAEVTGSKPPGIKIPDWAALATGRLNSGLGRIFRYNPGLSYPLARISKDTHFYSNRKATEELEMPQTPLPVAVREAWEWLKQNGKI